MREGISYTVTLNLVITFIIIFFFFLSGTLIYFKTNKAAQIVTNSIEKYEGYNELSEKAIYQRLFDVGYGMKSINCRKSSGSCKLVANGTNKIKHAEGDRGYCVYYCEETDYYYYKISTNGLMNLPLINQFMYIPVISSTNRMYDFEKKLN